MIGELVQKSVQRVPNCWYIKLTPRQTQIYQSSESLSVSDEVIFCRASDLAILRFTAMSLGLGGSWWLVGWGVVASPAVTGRGVWPDSATDMAFLKTHINVLKTSTRSTQTILSPFYIFSIERTKSYYLVKRFCFNTFWMKVNARLCICHDFLN